MQKALQSRSRRRRPTCAPRAEFAQRSPQVALAELTRRHQALDQQLAGLRGEYDDLRRALYEAAQTQRKLCGPRILRSASLEIAAEIFPVRDLSGDFISLFEFQGDVVFAIGDIAGKGLPASLWFTQLLGMIRLHFATYGDPARTVAAINWDLLAMNLESPLATLFLARVNPRSGEITFCNAGHPPVLRLRAAGQVERLRVGGPLLGAIPQASFLNGRTLLCPGDTLLGYSDGITERCNPAGNDLGPEQLLQVVRAARTSSAAATLFSVLAAVEDFAGPRRRDDDMALLVVQRAGDATGT